MKVKTAKILLLAMLSTLLLLGTTQSAFALMSTMGIENTYTSRWSGVNMRNYVMSSPVITGVHINSAYIFYDPNDFVEVGWAWYADRTPALRWFVSYLNRDDHPPYVIYRNNFVNQIANPTPGTNVMYEINTPNFDTNWNVAIDGQLVYRIKLRLYKGNPQGSSERMNTNESGYGRFWDMKKKDYTGLWYLFSGLKENDHPQYDNDPGYYFKKNSASSFEAFKNSN